MANANIPLSVNQVDVVNPLLLLQQGQRQQRLDQQQATESKQIGELRSAQLEGQNMQNQAVSQELQRSVLQNVARYGIAFNDLVQQDNLQAAGQVAQEMKRIMTQANIPTTDVDNLLRTFNNPQKLKQDSAAAVDAMKVHLPALFSEVKNDAGATVAQRGPDGRLYDAPKGMQGGDPLDQYIQALEVENKTLDNQRLQGQIQQDQQQQAARNAEAERKALEQSERQAQIQTEKNRALELTQKLLKNTNGLERATGPISARMPTLRQDALDFEDNLKELENLLTLGNLGRMTGVLSETDIKILANAASGISLSGSEQRMKDKLTEIYTRLGGDPQALAAPGIPTSQPQSGQVQRRVYNPQTGRIE